MKLNAPLRQLTWGHRDEGGTGVTNMCSDYEERTKVYLQAAINIGLDGICVVDRGMDGTTELADHSLHYFGQDFNLSEFWKEVRRLEGLA